MLSCADKLANLRSTKQNYLLEKDAVWNRFNRGKQYHCWYFSKLIDAFTPLQDYDMFWELNTIYKELFVSYYQDQDVIYQTNFQESYCFRKKEMKWKPIEIENTVLQKMEEITQETASAIIEAWEDEWI